MHLRCIPTYIHTQRQMLYVYLCVVVSVCMRACIHVCVCNGNRGKRPESPRSHWNPTRNPRQRTHRLAPVTPYNKKKRMTSTRSSRQCPIRFALTPDFNLSLPTRECFYLWNNSNGCLPLCNLMNLHRCSTAKRLKNKSDNRIVLKHKYPNSP